MDLVYKHETPLFVISLVISLVAWLLLIFGTLGIVLLYLLFFFIFYLFAHSAVIAHMCCESPDSAVRGLSALAAGHKRWQSIDSRQYLEQVKETGGFWMSFHELIADYPWLVKRVARVSAKGGAGVEVPSRNPLAWFLALFIPRLGIGGNPAGALMFIAIIGILAAVAIPAYHDYTVRAKILGAVQYGDLASKAVEEHIYKNNSIPLRLEEAGVASSPKSKEIKLARVDPKNGVIQIVLAFSPVEDKSLLFVPSMGPDKKIQWHCASEDVPARWLPQKCR